MPDKKIPFREDDLVSKIVTDPKNPPNTLMLTGYLGKSAAENYIRLYFDEELSDYVDIPQDAVLHARELPPDVSPLGGSYVWIQRDAQLLHGAVSQPAVKASFLEGRIHRGFMAGAAGGAAALPLTPRCPSGAVPCPSDIDPCTTFGPRCPTTVGPRCTGFGPNCPALTLPDPRCPQTAPDPRCPVMTIPDPRCPPTPPDPRCPIQTVPDPRCPTQTGPRCTTFGPQCRTDFVPCPTDPDIRCTAVGPNCTRTPFMPCLTDVGPRCPTTFGPNCF